MPFCVIIPWPHGGAVIMERICAKDHGSPTCPSVVPLEILHSYGLFSLKWLVLSTSVWNDPSIWRPWLFSLRSALRRAYLVVSRLERVLLIETRFAFFKCILTHLLFRSHHFIGGQNHVSLVALLYSIFMNMNVFTVQIRIY